MRRVALLILLALALLGGCSDDDDNGSDAIDQTAVITAAGDAYFETYKIDVDGDGTDELYVAADVQGELRRYVWVRGRAKREVILRREIPMSRMTWNIMPVEVGALRR